MVASGGLPSSRTLHVNDLRLDDFVLGGRRQFYPLLMEGWRNATQWASNVPINRLPQLDDFVSRDGHQFDPLLMEGWKNATQWASNVPINRLFTLLPQPLFGLHLLFTGARRAESHRSMRPPTTLSPKTMGALAKLVLAAAVVVAAVNIHFYFQNANRKLDIPTDGYFGAGKKHPDNTAIKAFKINVPETTLQKHPDNTAIKAFNINVPETTLQDLKRRLEQSRLGHQTLEDVNSFEYGFNSKYLLEVKDYWLKKYDWRKHEAILNSFPQFTTEIEGLNIHFLRVEPPKTYKKVYPLLMVHGWPGNVFEFYKILPMLTDPNKSSRC
uniref:EHN domain-containing protein n=1 Tax=Steinernema glaseri TaxID=37863 RepID=A0A1I7Y971_9BILA